MSGYLGFEVITNRFKRDFPRIQGRRVFLDNSVDTGSQERLQRGQRALLCREDQLLLRFFDEGSRQLKLIRAILVK